MPNPALTNANTSVQPLLFPALDLEEDPSYLTQQLITCIGNKRSLLPAIGVAIDKVKKRLGKSRLSVLDAFAGSGVVSRYLKAHAEAVTSNDIEDFAVIAGLCYLRNRTQVDVKSISEIITSLNDAVDRDGLFAKGFIEELYAPREEAHITIKDRVFYTRRNARRLDNYRRLIGQAPPELRAFLLGPLLSEASVHANTAGVFKGFYKDRKTKIGRFGGTNGDALRRILGEVRLESPVFSRFECDVTVTQEDANALVRTVSGLDLAYFDPPYNQHPYGSNYFMLNLLVNYQRPTEISKVSGIPIGWKRSEYNVRARSLPLFRELVQSVDAKFLLVSFNNEGFISPAEMRTLLGQIGKLEVIELKYNTFRGSRNFRNRSIHVTEQLFLVERN